MAKTWKNGKLVEVSHPDRKCQDCIHYVSRGYCDRGSNPDVTGPEAQSCYSYVTETTVIRRDRAPLPEGMCPKCHDYCYGDCEAANA